jgi:hypothetical protein
VVSGSVAHVAGLSRGDVPALAPKLARHGSWRSEAGRSTILGAKPRSRTIRPKEILMVLTAAHISPLVALIAGILILVVPQLLNYVVAIYLIVVGLVGLNDIYHFVT